MNFNYHYYFHRTKRQLMRFRRKLYGMRKLVPGFRERHTLETMVGPLGYWDKLQDYQLNALLRFGLKPTSTLLDIGCGPLQGGLAFIRFLNRCNYTGFDKSTPAIAAAHMQVAKLGLAHKNPYLIQSITFGMDEIGERAFDYMWASQILYYFDLQKMEMLFRCIRKYLKPSGLFLGDILSPSHYEFRFPEHGLRLHTVKSIQQVAKRYGFHVHEMGEIEYYGYPKRLSLRSNVLIAISSSRKPQKIRTMVRH